MGDQWKDQDVRDSESEQVRSRAMNEGEDVDEFDDVTEDQDDEEDADDEGDSTF
jgi:hypothetical protein